MQVAPAVLSNAEKSQAIAGARIKYNLSGYV
jgi:hypothetical protein